MFDMTEAVNEVREVLYYAKGLVRLDIDFNRGLVTIRLSVGCGEGDHIVYVITWREAEFRVTSQEVILKNLRAAAVSIARDERY